MHAILEREDEVSDAPMRGSFPVEAQERFCRDVVSAVGFDPAGWRLDVAVHPFASNLNTGDIRITTRYNEAFLGDALFGALHETGHGLYEAGSDPALERTPLSGGVSLGLHESQSRLWENLVGRSRPFAEWVLPHARAAFPGTFDDVDADAWYRAVNKVERSLIRVDADEATYSLHVILRFELEQDMVEGRIAVADVPEAWEAKIREYLGIEVPDVAHGALQDVHWSEGHVGYFPTYALGNVMSAQIWSAARAGLPDLDDSIRAGDFAPLRAWLGEHLYRHGRRSEPRETLRRAAGGPLDAGPYLAYLREKFGALYGLET
jgi:carboxypeptidase Taq